MSSTITPAVRILRPLTSVHNCRNQSPMKSICTLLLAVSFSILVSVRSPADEVNSVESGSGLIWLAATVHLDGGTERIDLGDVHGVLEGDRLAVFRSTDGHHTPLGTIQVTESRATWSYINTTAASTLREGDLVLGVRNVRQQGTGEHMQNGFLRRQLIRSGSRNGYSSTDRVQSALTLRSLVRRQNRWVKEKKRSPEAFALPALPGKNTAICSRCETRSCGCETCRKSEFHCKAAWVINGILPPQC